MVKIIPLQPSEDYENNLKQIKRLLLQTKDDLFLHAINLCSCGVWEDWMDMFEHGEEFEFDTDMIRDSGDPNAVMVVEVMEKLNEVVEELGEISNK